MSRRDVTLWTSVLAAPVIWFCTFEANFAWAPWTCIFQVKMALYLVSLAGLLLCAGSASIAWSQWKQLGVEWPGDAAGSIPRGRFMALGAVAINAFCFLVILAQAIPEVVLGACE